MSEFILKDFSANEHFEEVSSWWKFWRWNAHPTPQILSDIGYIVEKDGLNLCAGWLYTTNSVLGSMEYIISNPFADKKVRSDALDFLIECLFQRNLKEGKLVFMTSIKNESLAKRLVKLGFLEGDQNIKQFIRVKS